MRLTVQVINTDQILPIEVDDEGTIDDLKVMISFNTNIPVENQVILHNQKPL